MKVVKMWGCPECNQVYKTQDELGRHILADHVQAVTGEYQCHVCDHPSTYYGQQLFAEHITENHTAPPHWNCPFCKQTTGHDDKQSVLDHVMRSHMCVQPIKQCGQCEELYMVDEEMVDHVLKQHCLPTLID
ncbi:hypothetical protein LSTR_LSTR010098 [Laodelphax striatellus]|uniref:C2H2-type domain-containing protein n=1 Tax=Laodelphax striatellus TaxID=195883 RepID=A0A482X3F4_LAOST|nr:hypothetical protein LSTR_LSTR010098 [Laodelphax striatellus]